MRKRKYPSSGNTGKKPYRCNLECMRIHDVEKEIIPTTQHILDSYPQLSVEEKNRLWKIVMERITAYRTPGGEVSIHIYPKLPMR